MAKSLDEILKKLQDEQSERNKLQQQKDNEIFEAREKARLEYIKRNKMFEKAFNPSAAASSAAGAGGGRITPLPTHYILSFEYYAHTLNYIEQDGTITPAEVQPFNGSTVMCDCQDDTNFVYFVTYNPDTSLFTFGKLNKTTLNRIDIDTANITDAVSSEPGSLYYEGSGNFIYLDTFFGSSPDVQNILRISQDGATITPLSTFDANPLFIHSLCKFGGQTYAVLNDSYIISRLDTIDIETASTTLLDYLSMNVDTLPDGIVNTKVWYTFDLREKDGELWGSFIFTDKDDGVQPYACIGKLNVDNQDIDYVIGLPYPFPDLVYSSFVFL